MQGAAWPGHSRAAQVLIDAGAAVEAKDNAGHTALHRASLRGHTDIVKSLIDAKADIDVRDNDGRTCLHLAARWSHAGASIALLQAGADISIAGSDGNTARDWALSNGQLTWISQIDAWCAANEARVAIDRLLQSSPQECVGAGGFHV